MPIFVKEQNGQYIPMTDDLADSLFKLRLTGPLRKRLETEAAKRGLTLTAEILRRIDETFSDMSDRMREIEERVLDKEYGNHALDERLYALQREVKELQERVANL